MRLIRMPMGGCTDVDLPRRGNVRRGVSSIEAKVLASTCTWYGIEREIEC
jgi:hypothetical protein